MTLTYADVGPEHLADVGPKVAAIAALARRTSLPLNPGVVFPRLSLTALTASLDELVDAARRDDAALAARAAAAGALLAAIPSPGGDGDGWPAKLRLGADGTVVVRTSLIDRARPAVEVEGVGTSRVCAVADVPSALRELVVHLLQPAQLTRLASLGPRGVDVAALVNPFPHHDAAGVCTSYDVGTGDTARFELHLGHGQLYGITRGYTTPDAYLVDRRSGAVLAHELGHATEAVRLDGDGRYVGGPLPAALVGRSVAEAVGLDDATLAGWGRQWVTEVRRATGHDRFSLEFCVDRYRAAVVTDVRYG